MPAYDLLKFEPGLELMPFKHTIQLAGLGPAHHESQLSLGSALVQACSLASLLGFAHPKMFKLGLPYFQL